MDGLQLVYVHYRTVDLLVASVASVLAAAEEVPALEVTVVDNSCDDAVWRQLQQAMPSRVTLLRSTANLGFAAGCNRGAAGGHASCLLFLNPDTLMPPGSLGALWGALERYRGRAVIGPRHYADRDMRYAHAPLRATRWGDEAWDQFFARGWSAARPGRYLAERWRLFGRTGPVTRRAISGGCLAISRRAFTRLGGWDERFWMYGEDVDLCLRARRRGLRVLYYPGIPVVHYMEASARQLPGRVAAARRLGRDQLKMGRYGRSASRIERLWAQTVLRMVPRRRSPWAGIDALPDAPLRRERDGAVWAIEMAPSPLFDNCLTWFPNVDVAEVPWALIAGLSSGRCYLRTAERENGVFRNTGLWSFEGGGTSAEEPAPGQASATLSPTDEVPA